VADIEGLHHVKANAGEPQTNSSSGKNDGRLTD